MNLEFRKLSLMSDEEKTKDALEKTERKAEKRKRTNEEKWRSLLPGVVPSAERRPSSSPTLSAKTRPSPTSSSFPPVADRLPEAS